MLPRSTKNKNIKEVKLERLDPHFANAKSLKGRRKRSLIYILIGCLILVGAYLLFLKSPIFTIREFRVSGEESNFLSDDGLKLYMEDRYKGRNLFLENPAGIERDVKEFSPYIKQVSVTKDLPSNIELKLSVRTPFAVVFSALKCAAVDQEGVVLYLADDDMSRDECVTLSQQFAVPMIQSEQGRIELPYGERSSLYKISDFKLIFELLEDRGFKVEGCLVSEELIKLSVSTSIDPLTSEIVISTGQELELQLRRLILVSEKILEDKILFTSLDLRYKRPVLTKR